MTGKVEGSFSNGSRIKLNLTCSRYKKSKKGHERKNEKIDMFSWILLSIHVTCFEEKNVRGGKKCDAYLRICMFAFNVCSECVMELLETQTKGEAHHAALCQIPRHMLARLFVLAPPQQEPGG